MHWTAAVAAIADVADVAAVASCWFAGCLAMHFVKRTTNWSSGPAEKGEAAAAWIVGVVVMAAGYKTLQVLTALVDGSGISALQAKYIHIFLFYLIFLLPFLYLSCPRNNFHSFAYSS